MLKTFTGPLGTFLKGFITAVLTTLVYEYQTNGVICNTIECIKPILWSGVFATLPVVLNWLNPHYKQYGLSKKEEVINEFE